MTNCPQKKRKIYGSEKQLGRRLAEDWQSKIWLLVKLKKLARIFAIKATKRAGRRRSEEIAQVENQKWKLYYECEKAIFKAIQTKAFLKEQREAKNKDLRAPNQRREISTKSSPQSPHNPFMDKDGLLRVGSRLISKKRQKL